MSSRLTVWIAVSLTIALAWYAATHPLVAYLTAGEFSHEYKRLTILAFLAIVVATASFVLKGLEDDRSQKEQASVNRILADLYADHLKITGVGNATDPLARFEQKEITSLRAAGQFLAATYRDFASKPPSEADLSNGKYLKAFWNEFPFIELSALKDRLQGKLGAVVTSPAEALPSSPGNIKLLAKHLDEESLKVGKDVLL